MMQTNHITATMDVHGVSPDSGLAACIRATRGVNNEKLARMKRSAIRDMHGISPDSGRAGLHPGYTRTT